jgi:hypothetical protein
MPVACPRKGVGGTPETTNNHVVTAQTNAKMQTPNNLVLCFVRFDVFCSYVVLFSASISTQSLCVAIALQRSQERCLQMYDHMDMLQRWVLEHSFKSSWM